MKWCAALGFGLAVGCTPSDTYEGPGDARITADGWAWPCDFDNEFWVGTKHFFVDLQYAPESVETRPLPEPGTCSVWSSTFARDDLLNGRDLPDVTGFMEWALVGGGSSDRVSEGTFQPKGSGYWHSDAYDEHHTCHHLDTVIKDGVEVRNAPSLEGVSTPKPGTLTWVDVDTDILQGIPYGTEFTATWDAAGWQDQFIILNRSRSGLTVESVVCNVQGQTTFTADSAFWALSNPAIGTDASRFMVGFRNVSRELSATGLKTEALTRGLWHVAVVE